MRPWIDYPRLMAWEPSASLGGLVQLADESYEGDAASLTGRGFRPAARIALAQCGPLAGLIGAADLARRRQS